MYEITHKGVWLKWSALDQVDRRLLALSLLAAAPPTLVLCLPAAEYGWSLGYRLGSGGRPASANRFGDLAASLPPAVILATLACAILSALAWWRFSLRQDEMFNRIQNYALGRGCAWTVATGSCWLYLAMAGLAPALPHFAWLVLASFLISHFWFRAVRRWA